MSKTTKKTKQGAAIETPTRRYFVPDYGVSVKAASIEEANQLAAKAKETGDGK